MVTGTPGDLSGNGVVGPEDRTALLNAISGGVEIAIATAQNLFDLNADEVVDALDLAVFDTHFGSGSLAVPEPSAVMLVLVGVALAARRR